MDKKQTTKHVCPVCGRFTTEKAINKYQRMVNDIKQGNEALLRERAELTAELDKLKAENHNLQRSLAQHEQTEGALHKTIADQAKHITGLDAEVRIVRADLEANEQEVEKLYARSLWQRILNIIPE